MHTHAHTHKYTHAHTHKHTHMHTNAHETNTHLMCSNTELSTIVVIGPGIK